MIYNYNYETMNTPRHMSDPCQGNFQSQCLCSKGDHPEWNFTCFLNNRDDDDVGDDGDGDDDDDGGDADDVDDDQF